MRRPFEFPPCLIDTIARRRAVQKLYVVCIGIAGRRIEGDVLRRSRYELGLHPLAMALSRVDYRTNGYAGVVVNDGNKLLVRDVDVEPGQIRDDAVVEPAALQPDLIVSGEFAVIRYYIGGGCWITIEPARLPSAGHRRVKLGRRSEVIGSRSNPREVVERLATR